MNEKRKKLWAIKRKVNRFSSLIYMRVHRYLTLHPELLQSEEGKFLHDIAIESYTLFSVNDIKKHNVELMDFVCGVTAKSEENDLQDDKVLVEWLLKYCAQIIKSENEVVNTNERNY